MINTWNESLLHEELKDLYCGPKGQKEVPLLGSICDVVTEKGDIIEIQTAQLGKLRLKLEKLLQERSVTLVFPVARNCVIETYAPDGSLVSRRKSPKHANAYAIFGESTGLWRLLGNPKLTIELVHADILEIRVADGTGSWRRKGIRKADKKLLCVHERTTLRSPEDWARLLPPGVPQEFTVKDLQQNGAGKHAGKMAWTLRKAGFIELTGKNGNSFVYRRVKTFQSN